MRFKDLTEKDVAYIKKVYFQEGLTWDERMNKLIKKFGKQERTVRRWISRLNIRKTPKAEEVSEQYEEAKKRKISKNQKRFIITWGQNNTPIHKDFFDNIKAYAEFIGAEILVIAGRYKNPTSIFVDKKQDVWSKEIVPYLDANRHDIHQFVSIMSDVKIQPTAVNPLTGMAGMSGGKSCIFGSPKVHMETIPTLEGHQPKIMLTTGAVTQKNYTDSKAGKKGEFHHTLGFVLVEIKNKNKFFARQVTADNKGDFYDLYYHVKGQVINKINSIEAIVMGDIHLGDEDNQVIKSTEKLLSYLKPNKTIIHDLFNGYSISHHHENDPILKFHKEQNGTNSLKDEIRNMIEWIKKMQKYNLVIVRSNHDDFVDRWILRSDWKKDVKNSLEYMEYTSVLLKGKAKKGIIPYIINENFKNIITLNRDESFKIKGWELGAHGDYGSNGSRGNLNQFRKLNTKIIVGHYHSPGRRDGALSVGTSTKLRLEYNYGPSSWLQSHVIIHQNGKAQHINFIDGDYTTFEY